MRRSGAKRGVIVAFSIGKGAYEEIARAGLHDGMAIKPLIVKELLKVERQLPEFDSL